jgi:NAD(P)-dependent dehydrogenase (short-subunit alcohol dehydrogenase family)
VVRTLEAIRSAGAAVAYYAADVRDAGQVRSALEQARSRFGPIRGLIHGAGVIEDRLIADKSMEQFERVFDTKLNGFRALMAAAGADELKTIVIFSSVTARIGNRGQADYAMANEALNKLAWAESQRRPGCRVVSINWGPWECGMVTPSIKREFERQGVTLLPASDGAHSLLAELGRTADAPSEVVIGGTLNPAAVEAVREKASSTLAALFEREINVDSYPVLRSHIIDGRAVVPMALMAEWFGHGALHENPGLILQGLEDLRILKGIRLGLEPQRVRILAGKAKRQNGFFEVELELRNGAREGRDILHSRARAVLTRDYSAPPAFRLPPELACNHYPLGGRDLREDPLPRQPSPGPALGSVLHLGRHGGGRNRRPRTGAVDRRPPAQRLAVRPARARFSLSDGEPLVLRTARMRLAAQPRRFLPPVPGALSAGGRQNRAGSPRGQYEKDARRLHVPGRRKPGHRQVDRLRSRHGPAPQPGLQAGYAALAAHIARICHFQEPYAQPACGF